MLSQVEAANATEVQKKAFPDVSAARFAGISRNKGCCAVFEGPSPTFPQPIRRRGGCGRCSMLGGLLRIERGSYFQTSPNSCCSSQMATNIAGLSLDRLWTLDSQRRTSSMARDT